MKKTIAIIPARGGSKGLPGKNIKSLAGNPLIVYTIKAALKAKGIDDVIVSTDSEKIAVIARKAGAKVPFLRPRQLSLDHVSDRPVIVHALGWAAQNWQKSYDYILYLRPTTPFKTPDMIERALKKLKKSARLSAVRSVSPATGAHHPFWMYKDKNGRLRPFVQGASLMKFPRRQLLPKCLRLNGVVDVMRAAQVLKSQDIYGNNIGFLEIEDMDAIDIDNAFDFKLCEFVLKGRKR